MTPRKIIGKCIACSAPLSEPLAVFENMPSSAQGFLRKEELSSDGGIDIPLAVCPSCGLYQLFVEPVSYYRDVVRAVGTSETMKEMRRSDFRHLLGRYDLAGKKWVEVGVGTGDFLEILREFPVDIFGTEHDPESVLKAREKLSSIASHIYCFFPEDGESTLPGAPFDVFLSFNFLEHQPDPISMLRSVHRSLSDDGIGLVTVPSFEYILSEGYYYELIRDHIANFDMNSLSRLFEMTGFEVLEKDFLGIGDTLRLIVRKKKPGDAKRNKEGIETVSDIPEKKSTVSAAGAVGYPFCALLLENYPRILGSVSRFTEKLRKEKKKLSLWGAGHQGLTIASTTSLSDSALYIVDSSKKKQGLFAPASHLAIVSPETLLSDPPDVILITAPGYTKEIMKKASALFGERAVPCPEILGILDII